jgi:CRISPR/Cas system CSM-associated protein Csm3 (group 7 of RAMP superfamily)
MNRAIKGKICVSGFLVASVPLSVGGMGTGEQVDLDLAVDGAGGVYIPGTSIAGPLRAWLASRAEESVVRGLFGFIEKKGNEGRASALFVADGPVKCVERERRHGVSIDGYTGTAKEHHFYTRALLPRGTRIPLRLELDLQPAPDANGAPDLGKPPENQDSVKALSAIVEALKNGEIRFGACKTRGFGELKLEESDVNFYDFQYSDALNAWLEGKDRKDIIDFTPLDLKKENGVHSISIDWAPVSPIMVKSGRDGIETDMMPLVSGTKDGVVPVIPGSSLKGVLRAQAEKIMRTLFAQTDVKVEPWLDIVYELFGDEKFAGRLSVDDVYCSVQAVERKAWLEENIELMNRFSVKQQHVAIDRFTGGASEGALYSARPVKPNIAWDPIHLRLDLSDRGGIVLASNEKNQLLALVKLLLRDLEDGMIPVGFGTGRGLGEIEIKEKPSEGIDSLAAKELSLQKAWDAFIEGGGKFKRSLPPENKEKERRKSDESFRQ